VYMKHMMYLRLGLLLPRFTLFIVLSLMSCSPPPTLAATVIAADGAVGVNASWEAGSAPNWYIEEQRCGVDYIRSGIAREDPKLIQQGLTIFDWGFARQAADGSFPGTAGGQVGPTFQSIALFTEGVARAVLLLRQYRPVTYSLNPSFYAATLTRYKTGLNAACYWMMQPAVASAGQIGNLPYTHRRWLLAAALGETAALTGDNTIAAGALPYVRDGLSLQLPTGWRAALTKNPDGTVPPAILVAPGQQPPIATFETVNAAGVNPEKSGYDVNYQAFGLFLAANYLPFCPDATLQSQIKTMIAQGLPWEAQWVDGQGNMSSLGSSRVGIELNHDGTVKQIALGTITQLFQRGAQLLTSPLCSVVASRLSNGRYTPNTTPISADGAVGTNAAWESGTAISWNIGLQSAGADWVQSGVKLENDAMIRQGLQALNWGFAHQAGDGSFGGTTSPFYASGQFVEAAARAALLLQQYHPVTYTADNAFYVQVVSTYSINLLRASGWLMRPDISQAGGLYISSYSSRLFALAAALAETGQLTSNASILAAGAPYARQAFLLQPPDGADLDAGVSDINRQAYGLLNAERFAGCCPDITLRMQTTSVVDLGLVWEAQWVSIGGVVTGTSSPSRAILQSFLKGADLTGDTRFSVISSRLQQL